MIKKILLFCITTCLLSNANAEECDKNFAIDHSKVEIPSYLQGDWKKNLFTQGSKARNKQGWLSVAELKQQQIKGKSLLVDIRSAEQFAAYRLPQSMNIPARLLASKHFLKDKPLVLINQGFSVAPMDALYQQLLDAGFKQVSLLKGGLHAWQEAGGVLTGDALAIAQLQGVSATQLFVERRYQDLHIIELSLAEEKKSVPAIKSSVQKKIATEKSARWLIVSSKEDDTKIATIVSDLRGKNVFYLQGGRVAYEYYLTQQLAMWNRPKERQGKRVTCGRRRHASDV